MVDGLTVRFGGITALAEVSFTVAPGSMHALIGPNGAGKSTCLNVLTGVYAATAGSVRYGDRELTRLRPHRIAALGVARTFQNIALSPRATVLDNLLLARHRLMRAGFLADGLRLPRARRERAAHEARVREIAGAARPRAGARAARSARSPTARASASSWRARCAPSPACCCSTSRWPGMTHDESTAMAAAIAARPRGARASRSLLVEHDMAFVMGIADRVTVLDFGRGSPTARPPRSSATPRCCAPTWEARREPVRRRCSIGGLFLGAIYALVALGFVTIFQATGVINFAQGSVLLLGAYVIGRSHDSIGFWPAVLARRSRRGGARVAADRRRADPPRPRAPTSARWRSSRSASTSCC